MADVITSQKVMLSNANTCWHHRIVEKYSKYMSPIPTSIKRSSQMGALIHNLVPPDVSEEFREKIVAWSVLCEQWPWRIAWVVKFLSATGHIATEEHPINMLDFFTAHVQPFLKLVDAELFRLDITKHPAKAEFSSYNAMTMDDMDGALFEDLVKESGITVFDVGSTNLDRATNELMSYTLNLNPVATGVVSVVALSFAERFAAAVKEALEAAVVLTKHRPTSIFEPSVVSKEAVLPYECYSRSLAVTTLHTIGSGTGCIGLYSPMIEDNSIIVESTIANLQGELLRDMLRRHPCLDDHAYALYALIEQPHINKSAIAKIFNWLRNGGQSGAALLDFEKNADLFDNLRSVQTAQQGLILLLKNTVGSILFCCKEAHIGRKTDMYHRLLTAYRGRCKCRKPNIGSFPTEKDGYDYEIVSLSAWHFRGCDNVWANIVKELKAAAEGHFGGLYAYQRMISAVATMLFVWVVFGALLVAAFFVLFAYNFDVESLAVELTAAIGAGAKDNVQAV